MKTFIEKNFYLLMFCMTMFTTLVIALILGFQKDSFKISHLNTLSVGAKPQLTAVMFDHSTHSLNGDETKQSLEQIILKCEKPKEAVDEFHQVVFRYEDKQVERTCRELYEFLAGGKGL